METFLCPFLHLTFKVFHLFYIIKRQLIDLLGVVRNSLYCFQLLSRVFFSFNGLFIPLSQTIAGISWCRETQEVKKKEVIAPRSISIRWLNIFYLEMKHLTASSFAGVIWFTYLTCWTARVTKSIKQQACQVSQPEDFVLWSHTRDTQSMDRVPDSSRKVPHGPTYVPLLELLYLLQTAIHTISSSLSYSVGTIHKMSK